MQNLYGTDNTTVKFAVQSLFFLAGMVFLREAPCHC